MEGPCTENWAVALHAEEVGCILEGNRVIEMEIPASVIGRKVDSILQVSEPHTGPELVGEICGRDSYANSKKQTRNCGFS